MSTNNKFNTNGVDFVKRDWDTLVILDACRYDTFVDTADLPGRTKAVESLASSTPEFLRANLDGKRLYDTVYVTANSQLDASDVEVEFHDVIRVWNNHWDNKLGVPPDVMTGVAREALKDYPNKRAIVHYIQPHLPFLGETGRKIHDVHGSNINDESNSIWLDKLRGTLPVSTAELRTANEENLAIALDSIATLLPELDGKTVITSDHGQLIGDRVSPIPLIEYGHPGSTYVDELVRVPWHVYESGPRKQIIAEPPVASDEQITDATVERRLETLGYVS